MSKLIEFFTQLYTFIRYDIWRITENELTRTRKITYRFAKIIVLSIRGYIDDKLGIRASALTYSILFAIIPLVAIIVSIAKGFGVEKLIESSLQNTFIGQANLVPTVMNFVEKYLETMQGGLFIGIGIAILLWSVMSFFMQVENTFNSIWQVKKSRSPVNQFTTYFSIILIIPILIALSSGFSIYFNSTISQTHIYHVFSPVLKFGVKFLPYFINWVIFTIIYIIIPNTRVRFKNALIAGISAGTAFQIFQTLYINGQINLSRYNAVYGSFAAIPLLLLWLQISCLIVLLGAEISYASQNTQNFEYEIDSKNISQRYKNFLTLFITHIIVKNFENQGPPLSSDQIAANYKLPIRLVNQILTKLVETKVLIEVFYESKRIKTFQPAIDINQLTVSVLFDKLESYGSEGFLTNKNELLDAFWYKTLEIKQKSEDMADKILIKDI